MSGGRQARAIALLPGTVTVLIPAVILLSGDGPDLGWGLSPPLAAALVALGAALIAAGFTLGRRISRCQPPVLPPPRGAELRRRFGEDYLEYRSQVPRWIPRLRPWERD